MRDKDDCAPASHSTSSVKTRAILSVQAAKRARSEQAAMDFAALPHLALSNILDKLADESVAACAAVCRDWLQLVRSRHRNLRIVVRSPGGLFPRRAVAQEELQDLLGRFPRLTSLRIAGLAAADEVLPPLPPLPQLRALDLESCGPRSQPLSSWSLLENLTSLSYTERNCDLFAGKEVLPGLPLLQELSITCLSGDVHGLLSQMPELLALKSFSLTTYAHGMTVPSAAESYPWMRNLERLQFRFLTLSKILPSTADQLPRAILSSCSGVQHLSLSMECFSSGSILKAAGLKSLRSLQVHAVRVECYTTPEVEAAWMELRDKLTAICVTDDCSFDGFLDADPASPSRIRGLPSGLEVLGIPAELPPDRDISAASLTHLVSLRQLNLDIMFLSQVDFLTALRGITKLHTLLMTEEDEIEEMSQVQVLGALPNLRELVLDLWMTAELHPSTEAALLSGISQSSTEVNLGVFTRHSRRCNFPTSFVAALGERVSDLRICTGLSVLQAPDPEGGGKALSEHGACKLPRLRRLQLRFYFPRDFMQWLGPLRNEGKCSIPQLQYVCLVFECSDCKVDVDDQLEVLDAALCSAFPGVVEFCVHYGINDTALSLCASCLANGMDKHLWMDGECRY